MAEALLTMEPIGFIESPFETKNGTPRQPQLGSANATCRLFIERLAYILSMRLKGLMRTRMSGFSFTFIRMLRSNDFQNP